MANRFSDAAGQGMPAPAPQAPPQGGDTSAIESMDPNQLKEFAMRASMMIGPDETNKIASEILSVPGGEGAGGPEGGGPGMEELMGLLGG